MGAATSLVIVVALLLAAWAMTERANELNEHIYQQCITDELQDAVIVDQLEAALRRLRASVPQGTAERIYQEQVITDGINALDPPDEEPCNPPEGVTP